jgi:catechol 2,3-dioxygenase-like lactoylglutathione lyase family enzyme
MRASQFHDEEHPPMSINPTFGFALEYVQDIEATKRYYVEVLGLEVQRYHPQFVQFDRFAIAGDESMSGKNEPELYWLVEDAEAAFKDLSQKAPVNMPLRQMPFGKVFAIDDPMGRPRYLLELAQDRPSRPVT